MIECNCSFCGNKLSRFKSRIPESGVVYCNPTCQKLARINQIPASAFEDCQVTNSLRFWSKVAITADTETCWVWLGSCNRGGYGQFKVEGRAFKSHRYSWILMHGGISSDLCVLHNCDNPSCVNPHHLFLGTSGENNQDRERKGRGNQPKGIANGNGKISDELIAEIRSRYIAGNETHKSLAEEFGISKTHVGSIVRNEVRILTNKEYNENG